MNVDIPGHSILVEKSGPPEYGFDWICSCSYGGHAASRAAAREAGRVHALAAQQAEAATAPATP